MRLAALCLSALVTLVFKTHVTAAEDAYPHLLGKTKKEVMSQFSSNFTCENLVFSLYLTPRTEAKRAYEGIEIKFVHETCEYVNYRIAGEIERPEVIKLLKALLPKVVWTDDKQSKLAGMFAITLKSEDGEYAAFFNDKRRGEASSPGYFLRSAEIQGLSVYTKRFSDYLRGASSRARQ